MRHVRVRASAGGREAEVHPMFDILTNEPFVDRATALQWNVTDGELGILHYVEGDVATFESAVADVPQVIDHTVEPAGEGACYAYIHDELTGPARDLWTAVTDSGVVVVPPIVYHEDGTVTLSAFGPAAVIQGTIEAIEPPVEVTVEEVGGLAGIGPAAESRLSDRQRAALEAALEVGYYEIPREAGHEAVAAAIDCAPSTAAEHLRKAEARLVRSVLRG
ncbi:MAG: helix-turn-helix domain-containing protein [Halorientalis sp.]